MKEENLIFLISQPRSGSTLLQRVLGTHSEIYTRSEPWIILHSAYSLKQKDIQTNYSIKTWQIAFNDFIDNLPNSGKNEYVNELKKMHLNLYEKYTYINQKKYFLDKTPRYYLIIDELKRIFPKSKKILLIRDPLSVLSSILLTWVKDDYYKLANHKEDLFDAIDIIVKELLSQNSNLLFIKYESFLENPKNELQLICDYIGIEFSNKMLDFEDTDISNFIYGDPANARIKNKIDITHSKKWIKTLSNPQIWRFLYDYLNLLGENKFNKLGYSFEENLNILLNHLPFETLELSIKSTKGLQKFISPNYSRYSFSKQYNVLFETIRNFENIKESYIIYGYGTIGKTIQALIPDKILGYVDIADEDNHPKNLKNIKFDKIIISVLGREDEIIKYLVEDLQIHRDKIITLEL